jgi:cell division protein FtsB
VGILACALYLFANKGFRNLVVLTHQKHKFEKNLARLKSENTTLSAEWTRIQKDPAYTEYLIRRHLGYVKKGELEYRILVSSQS